MKKLLRNFFKLQISTVPFINAFRAHVLDGIAWKIAIVAELLAPALAQGCQQGSKSV